MSAVIRILTVAAIVCSVPALAQDQPPVRCSADNQEACLNGVSSTVTGFDALRNGRHRPILQRQPAELAEHRKPDQWTQRLIGDESQTVGIWSAYTASGFDGDYRGMDGTYAGYEGDVDTLMIGGDWVYSDTAVVGLTVGQERRNTATFYNGGGEDATGTTLMLYGLASLTDGLSVDGSAGYTDSTTNQRRIAPPPADGSARPLPIFLTAQFDARRYFGTLTGTWSRSGDHLIASASSGLLYVAELADGYTERGDDPNYLRAVGAKRISLMQLSVGGDLTWPIGDWDLYGLANYHRDLQSNDGSIAGGLPGDVGDTQPDDPDEYEYVLGLRYFADSGFTINGEIGQTLGRERYDNTLGLITIRQDF